MTGSRIVKYLDQLKQQGPRSANGMYHWLWMLASALQETMKPDSAMTAAAIAYFALFSLFPITLLSISVASLSLGPLMDEQLIIQKLEFIAPGIGRLLGQNIDEIIAARGSVSIFALVGLIWSASTVFNVFTHTLNKIWGVKRPSPIWKRRGLAILLVLAFVGPVLFAASIAGSLITHLRTFLPDPFILIGDGVNLVLVVLLDIALFMVLYMLLPHGGSTWREVLPGALAAGLLWELAKRVFLLFVSTYVSLSNLVYGSVAAIIAFLAWAHLSGLVFLFGAYLNVAYFQFSQQKKKQPEKHISKALADATGSEVKSPPSDGE